MNLFPKPLQFSHERRTHVCQCRIGIEQDGFQTAERTIGVSYVALILEVLDVAHAPHHETGTLTTGEVDGQVVVGFHLNSLLIGIELSNRGNPFLGRPHIVFVHIDAHADDKAVEKWQRTPHDRVVAHGERVETTHEDSSSHVCKSNN